MEEKVVEKQPGLASPTPEAVGSQTHTDQAQQVSKRSRKKLVINGLLALILIGTAVSVFAYYQFLTSPKMIILDTFKKFQKVTSFGYSIKIDMDLNESTLQKDFVVPIANKRNVGLGITLDGAVDAKDTDEVKSLMNVHLVTYGTGVNSIDVDAETRTIGDDFYIMMTKLPAAVPVPFSSLKDHWIHINIHDMQKKYSLPVTKQDKPLTKDQEERIQKVFKNPDLFTVTQKGSEVINDIDTYHYVIDFDKYELRNAIKESYKIFYEGQMNSKEREETVKMFDKMVIKETEFWIGKKDHMIYKIDSKIVFTTKDGDMIVPIKIRLKDHNHSVSVNKPHDAKDLEDLMRDMMQQYYYNQLQGQYNDNYKSSIYPSDTVLGARIKKDPVKEKHIEKELDTNIPFIESGIAKGIMGQSFLQLPLLFK